MDPTNPYAAPASTPAADLRAPDLFGYGSVVIASVVGSLLGGALILALNFNAMGHRYAAATSLVAAAGIVVGMRHVGSTLPWSPAGSSAALLAVWLILILGAMRCWQGAALSERRASGRRLRPWWLAFGLALVVTLGLLALPAVFSALQGRITPSG